MASPPYLHLLLIFLSLTTLTTASVDEAELDTVLTVLRARGYALFSNAIFTSELVYEILNTNSSFTFFGPTDYSLFAFGISNTASSDYTSTSPLRCHVVPLRLSFNQLRRFPSGFSLPTLSNNHRVPIDHHQYDVVSVGDAPLIFPGLFYTRHIAVHGLAGMLTCSETENLSQSEVYAPSRAESPRYGPAASPAYSPAIARFSPTEGPVTEFSEDGDLMAFAPMGNEIWKMEVEREEAEEREIAMNMIPSMAPTADRRTIVEAELERSEPLNEKNDYYQECSARAVNDGVDQLLMSREARDYCSSKVEM